MEISEGAAQAHYWPQQALFLLDIPSPMYRILTLLL